MSHGPQNLTPVPPYRQALNPLKTKFFSTFLLEFFGLLIGQNSGLSGPLPSHFETRIDFTHLNLASSDAGLDYSSRVQL